MADGSYYSFGEFRFDPRGRVLFRSGEMVPLYPKAIEVLACLVERRGKVTTKEDLLARVWPDTFVEESTLTRSISVLRKALGDTPNGHAFILTVPKRGYRFVADVREECAGDGSKLATPTLPQAAAALRQEKKLGTNRSVRAVWVAGLVAAAIVATAFLSWMRLRAKPVSSARLMIAVLPVQNLTGDTDREYISDGLTESIIAELGRMNPERLGVIARTSAMTYKHPSKTVSQIGDELHVQYVIESSLRQSGDHFRITTQLIRVNDQTHLWSQDYDRTVHDLMTVQDDLARAIAVGVRIELAAASHQSLASVRSTSPDAYMAYLEGRYYWNQRSVASLERAIVHLTQATKLDPNFALAYSGLADAYCSLGVIGDVAPGKLFLRRGPRPKGRWLSMISWPKRTPRSPM